MTVGSSDIIDESIIPAVREPGASDKPDHWPELHGKSERFWILFWIDKFSRSDQEHADFTGMLLDE